MDDNMRAIAIRQPILQANGFAVRTATNDPSGVEITNNLPIDAVILDYKMPGMDGEEVARRLRARHPHIPILLLTGFPGLIAEPLLSIVDGFLEKRSPATSLIAEVERLTRPGDNPGTEEQRRA